MLNKISIYLSENPTLRYWIIRPEWVAVILLILSIIASLQLSPFFADLAFIMDSATPYVEYGLIAIVLTLIIISGALSPPIASKDKWIDFFKIAPIKFLLNEEIYRTVNKIQQHIINTN